MQSAEAIVNNTIGAYSAIIGNPRSDNLGTITCWPPSIGDEHHYSSPADFCFALAGQAVGDTEKARKMSLDSQIEIAEENNIILPIYACGQTLSTTNCFSEQWGVVRVGYIWVSLAKVRQWYEVPSVTQRIQDIVIERLKHEIDNCSQPAFFN